MRRFACATAAVLLLAGCILDDVDDSEPLDCEIRARHEPAPGVPDGYDLERFRDDVIPALAASCANEGCHDPAAGSGGFRVWKEGQDRECDLARSFNSFRDFTDDQLARRSLILLAIDGSSPDHPVSTEGGGVEEAFFDKLLDLIRQANIRSPGGRDVTTDWLDYDVFRDDVMPMLDVGEGAGCTVAGCHGLETSALGFGLHRAPAPDSWQMEENFWFVRRRTDLSEPQFSQIYVRSTQSHADGASTVIGEDDAAVLLHWIEGWYCVSPSCAR